MKKTISFLLSCVMLFTVFTGNVFASSNTSAMEKERQRMYESIEAQLREQDALYLMDHFETLIDETIAQKYGVKPTASSESWYAPNGGTIVATSPNLKIEATFFNTEDTQQLYDHRDDTNEVTDLIRTILGAILPFGWILDVQSLAHIVATESMWKNIKVGNEGCYVYAVYDTLEMRTTTVIISWDPPYMELNNSTIRIVDHYINPY